MSHLSVGDLAKRFGVSPVHISSLLYRGRIDPARCPVISGRRMVPESMVPVVESVLRREGLLSAASEGVVTDDE